MKFYKTIVVFTQAKRGALVKGREKINQASEVKFPRSAQGYSDGGRKEDIRRELKIQGLSSKIRECKTRLCGNLGRMSTEELPITALQYKPVGRRRQIPEQSWA